AWVLTARGRLTPITLVASTSARSVLVGDAGTVFTNEGATSQVVFTLPAAASGLGPFTFVVHDTDGIRVSVFGGVGDSIRAGASVSTTGGYIQSTTIGDSITLVAINANEWVA